MHRLLAMSLGFFVALAASLSIHVRAASAGKQARGADRPNILLCLADDWAWPHAGACGDKVIKTPAFDRVAREGMLFIHAFSAAPSCTASRASLLTGQAPHRLGEGANLYGPLSAKFPVYPDLLESAGYVVGFSGKGWGPGDFRAGGRRRNPAGPGFKSFAQFLETVPGGKPFCFWFGSHDPHRPYEKGSGARAGMKPEDVSVPPYLPDTPEVRSDVLDYYLEAQRFDRDTGELLKMLDERGLTRNTLVVMSGDNGWPFPRGKANLYDAGTRQPLAVRWPARVKPAGKSDAFVSLTDLCPTFLEAAGLKALPEMTGQSLVGLLEDKPQTGREAVFVERERHANVRRGDLSYPSRAIRTRDFLYIRNFRPQRWPAGDPEKWKAVGPFGDCDGSPTKDFVLEHRDQPLITPFFQLAFEPRPAEELYNLSQDAHQVANVAGSAACARERTALRKALEDWLRKTDDPRLIADDDRWDAFRYGGAEKK